MALAGGPAMGAALAPAPFVLSASPPTALEGRELTLRLVAREGAALPVGVVDVYVAVIQDGNFAGAYLTPERTWSPHPEPFRRGVSLADLHGLTIRFQRINPSGWFTFRLYLVRASAEALTRKHYVAQPLDVTVRIDPSADSARAARLPLLAVGLLMAAAWVVVVRYPRRAGAPTASPSSG